MEDVKYLDKTGLGHYDEKIKTYIGDNYIDKTDSLILDGGSSTEVVDEPQK